MEAAGLTWVLSCPSHVLHLIRKEAVSCDPFILWLREGRAALVLEEVKVQGLSAAEGFCFFFLIYYKICYTNTADQKV